MMGLAHPTDPPRTPIDDAEASEIIKAASEAAEQLVYWSTVASDLVGQLLEETTAARQEGEPGS